MFTGLIVYHPVYVGSIGAKGWMVGGEGDISIGPLDEVPPTAGLLVPNELWVNISNISSRVSRI